MLASRSLLWGGFCPVSRTRTDTRSASTPRSPTKKRPTGRSLWRMPQTTTHRNQERLSVTTQFEPTDDSGLSTARRLADVVWSPSSTARRNRAQRLASYLVRTTPPGNVRVSTRSRFTQLSSAVKNGAAAHQDRMGGQHVLVDQPGPHGRPGERCAADAHRPPSGLERVISAIASPVTRRVFQSTLSIVEENDHLRCVPPVLANSISAAVALGC